MPGSISLLWGFVDGQLHQGTAISSSAATLLQGAGWNPPLRQQQLGVQGYQHLLTGGLPEGKQHLEAAACSNDAAAIGSNGAAETGSTTPHTDAAGAGSSDAAAVVQQLAVSCQHALLLLSDGRAFLCNSSEYRTASSDTDAG